MLKRRWKKLREFKINSGPLDRAESFVRLVNSERRLPSVVTSGAHLTRESLENRHLPLVLAQRTHPLRKLVIIQRNLESFLTFLLLKLHPFER